MQPEKRSAALSPLLIAHLYHRYASALLMYICRHVPTREDAEDVLLEVFQAAVESEVLTELDDGKQRAWLWSVAHNKVIDHHRHVQRSPISSVVLEEAENAFYDDDFYAPESVVVRQETYAELRRFVSLLPELQQEVLRLRFAHGLKCSEIAQQLNKSSAAIRVMLSRSLNLLRRNYKQSREDKSNG